VFHRLRGEAMTSVFDAEASIALDDTFVKLVSCMKRVGLFQGLEWFACAK